MRIVQPYVITIVGAESSGKTRLAMELATYFQCPWIPEYAREYLSGLERPYGQEDLEIIAARELERIDAHMNRETPDVRGETSDVRGETSDVSQVAHFIKSKIQNPMLRPANPHPWATAQQRSQILIIDGGILTMRMWARIKYQMSIPIVERALSNDVTDLYLLCSPRSEWEPDPFREAPDVLQRAWIYNQYLDYLVSHNVEMEIVRNEGGDVTFC